MNLEDVWVPLRRRLSRLKPANRGFDRFLASLDYVPADVEEPTGPNDVIICGSPRSGTTLLAAQLFQPPGVVSVMEPWDGLRMSPAALFRSLREELASGTLRRGKLDVDALRRDGAVRWTDEGTPVDVGEVTAETVLAVKWPSWWQYLDRLAYTRFIVCLRDPVEVIDSYRRTGGRLREGQDHPVALNLDLNRTVRRTAGRHLHDRRIALYDAVNQAILPHLDRPNVLAVRYERWFSDPERLRDELAQFLGVALAEWPATIRHPQIEQGGPDDGRAVRAACRTATALGYPA